MTDGDEDYEMGGMAQPPLPVLDWQVNLCNGLDFMRTNITRPAFDEVPRIDSSYENVSSLPLPSSKSLSSFINHVHFLGSSRVRTGVP